MSEENKNTPVDPKAKMLEALAKKTKGRQQRQSWWTK
jgi:hypothetical protein